jgi:hypothetical protein
MYSMSYDSVMAFSVGDFSLAFAPGQMTQVNQLESSINLFARPSLRYVRSTDRELTCPTCNQGNSSSGSLHRISELVINT